jgi:hypothetical protein
MQALLLYLCKMNFMPGWHHTQLASLTQHAVTACHMLCLLCEPHSTSVLVSNMHRYPVLKTVPLCFDAGTHDMKTTLMLIHTGHFMHVVRCTPKYDTVTLQMQYYAW